MGVWMSCSLATAHEGVPHERSPLAPNSTNLGCHRSMTTTEKLEALLDEIAELPDYAQTDLVESLLGVRAQQLGIYLDDDKREAFAPSVEDVRRVSRVKSAPAIGERCG